MDETEKNKILTTVKVLNEFSRRHIKYSRKLQQQLESNGIIIQSTDGYGGRADVFPEWFVDIIDFGGSDLESITEKTLNKLFKEMEMFNE